MSKNDLKLIIGEVGIKMSWVGKNRKINNGVCVWRGGGVGGDYSGLQSNCFKLLILYYILLHQFLTEKQ